MKKVSTTLIVGILLITCLSTSAITTGISLISNTNSNNSYYTNNEEVSIKSLNLEPGDIVWRWVDENFFPLFQYFMHSVMYIGREGEDYVFIDAAGDGKVLRLVRDESFVSRQYFEYVYRMVAPPLKKSNAVNFAKDQIGKNFRPIWNPDGGFHFKNNDPTDTRDPYANDWYCTELVWAAYYNVGIDIDSNGGKFVLPFDIHSCGKFERISMFS